MPKTKIKILIRPDGSVTGIYDDRLAEFLKKLGGRVNIKRASHVEPDPAGSGWIADMGPSGGPVLRAEDGKGFDLREKALDAERKWLEERMFGHESKTGI